MCRQGMGGMDRDLAGSRESHQRRIVQARTVMTRENLDHEGFISYCVTELEGDNAGKMLASFLLSKQEGLSCIRHFGSTHKQPSSSIRCSRPLNASMTCLSSQSVTLTITASVCAAGTEAVTVNGSAYALPR